MKANRGILWATATTAAARAAFAALAASAMLVACATPPSVTPSTAAPAAAPTTREAAIARVSDFIPKQMKARGFTGLGIAVSDSSGTVWSAGFGIADKGSGRKFDGATISNIGSVSKIFTATAIMRLAQEGKIDLDAPVSTYLPDFSPKAGAYDPSGVTVRGLLTHHSGLQSDYFRGFTTLMTAPAGYPRPYADNARLASDTTLCSAPGEVMSYSNLGYSLLGLIVEAASGKDFPSYVRDAIFEPLGMTSSSLLIEDRFRDRYATNPSGGKNTGIPYIRDMPAGSVNASVEDMGRFMTAVLAQSQGASSLVLDQPHQAAMWQRQNQGAALDFDFSIGLCYWIMDRLPELPGETVVGHGGDLFNYHALLLFDPARSLGVFVMVNSANGLGSFSIADVGAEAIRDFAAAAGQTPVAEPQPAAKPAPLPQGLAARLAGNYASPNGLLRIQAKGDSLSVYAFGSQLEGYYRDDGAIGLRAKILGFELPVPILKEIYLTPEDLNGETVLAMRSAGVLFGVGRKVASASVPSVWTSRFGTWVPVEKEPYPFVDALTLSVDKDSGLLLATLRVEGQSQAYPVRAVSDDRLLLLGSGRNLGSTIELTGSGTSERLNVFGVMMKKG